MYIAVGAGIVIFFALMLIGTVAIKRNKQLKDQSPEELIRKINKLDLERVRIKAREKLPWDEASIGAAIEDYRRFLFLHGMHSDVTISPSKAVDEIWHLHILDTKQYELDCRNLFGHHFHHDPLTGINQQRQKEIDRTTLDLERKYFPTIVATNGAKRDSKSTTSSCGGGCGGMLVVVSSTSDSGATESAAGGSYGSATSDSASGTSCGGGESSCGSSCGGGSCGGGGCGGGCGG